MGSISATEATHEVLVLSDSGSTVGFTVKSFMTEIGIIPSGLWRGHLETVNETRYHEISFYRIRFRSPDGCNVRDVLCLETPSLGRRDPLPDDLVTDVAKAFQVSKSKIFTAGGDVQVLLGQDTAALLLNKLDIKATQASTCSFYEDISLHTSPATTYLSIVGAIGEGSAVNEDSRNFHTTSHRIKPLQSKIQDGNFCFNNSPENEEIKIIQKYFSQCTYSVKRKEKPAISVLSTKDQGPPPKDGDPDDKGNDDPKDPPLYCQGSLNSQSQKSKTHCVEHNLKTLKQYFGQSKTLRQISPLRIIFILNFTIFAHTQLTLPVISPIFPECSYDAATPYSFNGLNNAGSETVIQVQWPHLDPLQSGSPADPERVGTNLYSHSTDCESAVPVQWPANSHQTSSTADQERVGLNSSSNLYSLYSLNTTDWPSDPLVDLIWRKKAGRTVKAIPNIPKIKTNLLRVKCENKRELQNKSHDTVDTIPFHGVHKSSKSDDNMLVAAANYILPIIEPVIIRQATIKIPAELSAIILLLAQIPAVIAQTTENERETPSIYQTLVMAIVFCICIFISEKITAAIVTWTADSDSDSSDEEDSDGGGSVILVSTEKWKIRKSDPCLNC
jgi:hypothetical protein